MTTNASTPPDPLAPLLSYLSQATSATELYKLGIDAEFKINVLKLNAKDQKIIREHYQALNQTLTGRVKLDELDGETLTITAIKMEYSAKYDNDFAIVTATREDGSKATFLSSAVRIVRWCQDNENTLPSQVVFTKEPHADGKTMWHVKALRPASERASLPWDDAS